ncbi:MAG TPA: hypothetical protein VM938_09790 [Acidimicrobiales bacterium]|nr:hypothetical protein [Acidimicrobiales bacterium]
MTTARRLRGLGACLLAAGSLVLSASPAHAGTPNFTWHSPAKNQTLATSEVAFRLTVSMPTSEGRLQNSVSVTFAAPAGADAPTPLSRNAHDQHSVDVTGALSFRWNGTYTARAAAQGRNNVLDQDTSAKYDNATFVIDAPPAAPTGVTTSVDKDTRVTTVRWAPNTEPDLIGYEVLKQAPDGRWVSYAVTAEPTVTDEATAYSGGVHRYRVVALRRAADPKFANSSAHTETSANVPAPPPGTPPPPDGGSGDGSGGGTDGRNTDSGQAGDNGAGGGTDSGGDGSSANGGRRSLPPLTSSGKVDLSDLDGLMAQAERQRRQAGENDGTFDPTLPFGARQGEGDGEGEGDDGEGGSALELGDNEDVAGRLQSLGFLAGGLLATVLAMHVLWIRSEVHKAEKAEALTPVAPEPRGEVSAEDRFGVGGDAPQRRSRSRARPPAEVGHDAS